MDNTIVRTSVVDQVYSKLRSDILSGKLSQGSRIVELQVARSLGTSRAPVREAINRLLQAGLVETRAHHGPSVARMTLAQTKKLFRLRSAVECVALEEFMRQPSPPLDQLRAYTDEMQKLSMHPSDDNVRKFVDIDTRFHETIWALSHNEYVQRVGLLLGDHIRLALTAKIVKPADLRCTADSHAQLMSAIIDNDLQTALQLMRTHLKLSEKRVDSAESALAD